jgi:DNA modification methylase
VSATILRADAAHLPIPDASVDLIVTSPPYWSLRSYTDGGAHYDGQIGDEQTPGEYIDQLIDCTREWIRVLKPTGSLVINLGDKYNAYNGGRGEGTIQSNGVRQSAPRGNGLDVKGIRPKSLIGLPWRYALRCIDDLGLILRAEIVWAKPNGLPESVTDRVRRSHEQVFHFVKQPRYFSAVDEVREAQQSAGQRHEGRSGYVNAAGKAGGEGVNRSFTERALNPLGKLPGSVWTIPTAPLIVPDHLGVDHFAAYPPELVRRIVLGWSPREVCTACGEGRRPVVDEGTRVGVKTRGTESGQSLSVKGLRGAGGYLDAGAATWKRTDYRLTGYACACPDTTAPATPGLVLDPFGGTGTTALVATCYGRHGISVDLSADYCRLARWRTTDPGERARVLQVPKPEPVPEAQMDLFGEWSA